MGLSSYQRHQPDRWSLASLSASISIVIVTYCRSSCLSHHHQTWLLFSAFNPVQLSPLPQASFMLSLTKKNLNEWNERMSVKEQCLPSCLKIARPLLL